LTPKAAWWAALVEAARLVVVVVVLVGGYRAGISDIGTGSPGRWRLKVG
jgi:hypothetical protein